MQLCGARKLVQRATSSKGKAENMAQECLLWLVGRRFGRKLDKQRQEGAQIAGGDSCRRLSAPSGPAEEPPLLQGCFCAASVRLQCGGRFAADCLRGHLRASAAIRAARLHCSNGHCVTLLPAQQQQQQQMENTFVSK